MRDAQWTLLIVILVAALLVVGIQVWATMEISRHSEIIQNKIQDLQQEQIAGEKAKQDLIAISIDNERKAMFWTGLVGSIGTMVAAFVALFGIWQGLRDYWRTKEKERLDRAATDLNKIWEGLANEDERVRAGAIVGLQHYLTPDKSEYHARIISTLVMTARTEDNSEVLHTITIALQQGMRQIPWELAHQISWQGVRLRHINLSGLDLAGFDFRDVNFEDAELQDCDLTGALFNAAILKGARLDNSLLIGADLEYADLAGASLVGAALAECNLANAKVLNVDLREADLTEANFGPEEIDWRLTINWRKAFFSTTLHDQIIGRYGPDVQGPRILMMLWEFPPLASGGAWTATYHIIRNLRRQGANLVLMLPWKKALLRSDLFGNEVELLTMEIDPPKSSTSTYGQEWSSPYGRPYSAYGGPSVYGTSYSTYGSSVYGYGGRQLLKQGPIGGIVREFQNRARRYVQSTSANFDIIYGADWPTFWAATEVAGVCGKPWVAHFHSTEFDRRQHPEGELVAIERHGAESADRIITPSEFTKKEVSTRYKVPKQKISVVPNPLSKENILASERGSFETQKVVFVGRFTWQKGPDLFIKICDALRRRLRSATFNMFGDSEGYNGISNDRSHIQLTGFIDWEMRGTAFCNASALVVPSRAEPFGMVVLESMERGVPVLYPQHAGAAEVLQTGIKIDPQDVKGSANEVYRLLSDRSYWEKVVREQEKEIREYYSRNYEQKLMQLFSEVSKVY